VINNFDLTIMQTTIDAAKKSAAEINLFDKNSINKKQILSLIDLTDLSDDKNSINLAKLCETAKQAEVAAICIWPEFITAAKSLLAGSEINIATVANFPAGTMPLADVLKQIEQAIKDGADEIDVVFPYNDFFAGKIKQTEDFLTACRAACQNKILKVILESGSFTDLNLLQKAATAACEACVDFLKTSTGKISQGATLEAAYIFLSVIHNKNYKTGIKISGGIRTADVAITYIELAKIIMGEQWIAAKNFRIGASQLVHSLSS